MLLATSLLGCGRVSYRARDAGRDASMDAFSESDATLDAWVSRDDANLEVGPSADATGDAHIVDAPSDAGVDARSPDATIIPATCPFDAIFCDGYDDGAFAAWTFSVTNGGSVSSATTPVHTGERSLRCVSDGGSAVEARYSSVAFGGQTSGDLWARAFFYLPATYPDLSIIAISDRLPPYTGAGLQIMGGRLGVSSGITPDAAYDTMPMPTETWVCVEFHIVAHPTNGVLEAYRDGALVARTSGFNTVPDTGYEVAEIGIHYVPAGPAFELYVDDVALSLVRVGCM